MMDDLDHIMNVMDAAFDPAFGEAWNRRQVSDALILPGTHCLLVGEGGDQPGGNAAAIGFALSRWVAGEEELLLLAIHPRHRRQGVGTILLRRYLAAAQDRGTTRIFLEMREGNPAEALYIKEGFQKVGRRTNYYRRGQGGPMDAITFALDCATAN